MSTPTVVVRVPRRLYEEARRRGIDVEAWIVETLARELGLDPRVEAGLRLELAERFLQEGLKFLERGDAVQASEKLYRAAEEAVKAMAEALELDVVEEVRRRGRWTLRLLDHAASSLADRIDRRVYDDLDHAYLLHVEGLHEARLSIDQVRARAKYVEDLLRIAREIIAEGAS